MTRLMAFLRANPLSWMLLALPATLVAQWLGWQPVAIFALAAIGIIPLASYIGRATEELAVHTGPRTGALLNATFGNAAELIITIAAVRAGLLELVKASITGSIIGNLLLVLGFAMVVGGVRHGPQTFNKIDASRNAILLVLAVIALAIPSIFGLSMGVRPPVTVTEAGSSPIEALSLGVAIVMIALYALGLFDACAAEAGSGRAGEPCLGHTAQDGDVPLDDCSVHCRPGNFNRGRGLAE